jgi:hypothetical protein
MTLPDNRVRLTAPKINFATDVGETGQDHDNYPPPQGQARFDHLRMYLIGLLAQQSSYNPPTQYRDGTTWFDLNDGTIKIRMGDTWHQLADAISVAQNGGVSTQSLSEFTAFVQQTLPNITPDIVYNGISINNNVTVLPIPESLRASIGSQSRPFVYVNGVLLDPRNTSLQPVTSPAQINIVGTTLNVGDTFTVEIRYVPSTTFYLPTVTAS